MSCKPVEPSRASARAKRPPILPPPRIRMPSAWRVVTARVLYARAPGKAARPTRRHVPEIRLSGAWLERVGFPKGTRYLISANRDFREIILLGTDSKPGGRRTGRKGR